MDGKCGSPVDARQLVSDELYIGTIVAVLWPNPDDRCNEALVRDNRAILLDAALRRDDIVDYDAYVTRLRTFLEEEEPDDDRRRRHRCPKCNAMRVVVPSPFTDDDSLVLQCPMQKCRHVENVND